MTLHVALRVESEKTYFLTQEVSEVLEEFAKRFPRLPGKEHTFQALTAHAVILIDATISYTRFFWLIPRKEPL